MRFYIAITLFFAQWGFLAADPAGHVDRETLIKEFQSNEKSVFEVDLPVKAFDIEDDHVWAAKRWVSVLTTPAADEDSFISSLWIAGQQIAALERQNRIYVHTKSSAKNASLVFEKELIVELQKFCAKRPNPKECSAKLKERALKLTELFWGSFKKSAVDDFKRNNLDSTRVTYQQIRGHIRKAYQDSKSEAWTQITDYVAELKTSGMTFAARDAVVHTAPAVSAGTLLSGTTTHKFDLTRAIRNAGLNLREGFGLLKPKQEKVDEIVKPWNYVTPASPDTDIRRAAGRYAEQTVRAMGCGHFEDASLLNGQIVARLLRAGSVDVAHLTERTNRALDNWCHSQFAHASEIINCKSTMAPHFARLNKYYWQEVKDTLGSKATMADVDALFDKMRKENAIKSDAHPLGKIHADITAALTTLKSDWGYRCTSIKEEALGDYRYAKALPEARQVAKNLLSHLKGNPLRHPPGYCAAAVKAGMASANVLTTHPYTESWRHAYKIAKRFEEGSYLSPGYEMKRVETLDPDEAPDYAIIVYGGAGAGHIEQKVPVADLEAAGIMQVKGKGKKPVSTASLRHAYVSDYIDVAPRNSQRSRIANGRTDNGRPVLGIYVIMRKN